MVNNIIELVRSELKKNVDSHTKKTAGRVFKEKVKFYGVKVATVTKISKKYFEEVKELSKKEIFILCEELFKSGFTEESFIACSWSFSIPERYELKDFKTFEFWLNTYVNNWATCDFLCNHTVGKFIMKFPRFVSKLKKWTKSKNRWVRRGAATSLIIPAQKGMFMKECFEIADLLMNDNDDLVQKGYGWLLKDLSKNFEKEVYNYVIKKKKIMPRNSLRYAIQRMPDKLKKEAMKKIIT